MFITLLIFILFIAAVYLFMQQAQFGKKASGASLEKIKNSPNYTNDKFQNLSPTPSLTDGGTVIGVIMKFIFGRDKNSKPSYLIPTVKTDLHNLPEDENVLVWFGHSSYFIQLDGKRILVDPVLSGHASPIKFTARSFKGSDVFTTEDIPTIDYLFITHDHYDHLDHKTILQLQPKIKKIITGLGTAAHLEHWGYAADIIIEKDWEEEIILEKDFVVNTMPARHFSGRGFKRNNALWMSFILTTPTAKVYLGGDSGYDTHFATIGDRHGPFDWVILENGQYNKNWKHIHMMPEEVVQAARDLKAKNLLPVHWSKFSLALHAWDEPIKRLTEEARRKGVSVVHPKIGEAVNIKDPLPTTEWWKEVK